MSANELDAFARGDIKLSFGRAADTYDKAANIQRQIGDLLLSSLPPLVGRVLDLGCGTGYCLYKLKQAYPALELVGLDIAEPMLASSRLKGLSHAVCADAHFLPFQCQSFNAIVSNLMIQWSPSPELLFTQCQQVLSSSGYFVFNSLLPGTLGEIEQAWLQVDSRIHVNRFVPAAQISGALEGAGFKIRCIEQHSKKFYFNHAREAMLQIKGIGGHNMNSARQRALTGKNAFQQFVQNFEALREPKGLPLTYQILQVTAQTSDN